MAVGGERDGSIQIGVWILVGLLTFMIIEKIFPESTEDEDAEHLDSTVSMCINYLKRNFVFIPIHTLMFL